MWKNEIQMKERCPKRRFDSKSIFEALNNENRMKLILTWYLYVISDYWKKSLIHDCDINHYYEAIRNKEE